MGTYQLLHRSSRDQSCSLQKIRSVRFHRMLICLAVCIYSATVLAQRPTVRIGKGNRLEFCQYAAANGSTYGPNCKLKIDNIQKAFADVSDVVIDGTFEIKRNDPQQRATGVFVANKMTINDGGRIV